MTHIQKARENREEIIDLLTRFVDLSRSQICALVFDGNVRACNRALLSLTKTKRLYRFVIERRGEYIYSLRPGPTKQTTHNLLIADAFINIKNQQPDAEGWGNIRLSDDVIADLLVRSQKATIVGEIHRATNSFGDKLERYAGLLDSPPPQYDPGKPVIHWIICPQSSVVWRERSAEPYRVKGMEVRVSSIPESRTLGYDVLLGAGDVLKRPLEVVDAVDQGGSNVL